MLIGAMVLAGLILMLLLAERGSNMMWRDGRPDALFYCRPCDLRYPRHELRNRAELTCPAGHTTEPVAGDFPLGTVAIATCAAFIVAAAALLALGAVPTP